MSVNIGILKQERRIRVQYSRRVRMGGAMDSYIPIS
jgi:hypothetical protein